MIPQHTQDALDRYIKQRLQPGGFLTAVLTNKLGEAFGRADDQNTEHLRCVVEYVYNDIPSIAWGSEEKVEAWIRGDHLKEQS